MSTEHMNAGSHKSHYIEFKTKLYPVVQKDETRRMAFTWKVKLARVDCTMKPYDHTYYNSDLFPGMLNKTYQRIKGEYKTWSYVDELPEGCSVDTSKFLAVVRVSLPENFR